MSQPLGRIGPMRRTSSTDVANTTRMPAISRRSIHCSESGFVEGVGFFFESCFKASLATKCTEITNQAVALTLVLESLQVLPGLFGVFAKNDDVVLALIEVEAQARLDLAFAFTKSRTRNVIDMNYHSTAFRMSKLEKSHDSMPQKVVDNKRTGLAAVRSR